MKKLRLFFGYLTLILIAISMLYPFFAMINLSFVNNNEIFSNAGKLIHTNLTFANYKNVFSAIPLSTYFLNSLIVAVTATFGQVVFASLAGYAFARMHFKYRDGLFLLIIITMLVPPQVNIIPLFFLMRELHLIEKMLQSFSQFWFTFCLNNCMMMISFTFSLIASFINLIV